MNRLLALSVLLVGTTACSNAEMYCARQASCHGAVYSQCVDDLWEVEEAWLERGASETAVEDRLDCGYLPSCEAYDLCLAATSI